METKRILITPETADAYLAQMEINRPLMARTVSYYADEMKRGQWCENTHQGIAFDVRGSLVDGQHRLKAVILSGKSIYMNVTFGVSTDSFKTMDSGSCRTVGQVMSIEGIKNYNRHAAGIVAYLTYIRNNTTLGAHINRMETKVTSIDAIAFYKSNSELCDIIGGKVAQYHSKRRYVTQSFLYSFMLVLIHKNRKDIEDVIDFLNQIYDFVNIKSDVCELMKNKLYTNSTSKAKLPSVYLVALLIKTWNSYISNQKLKVLKFQEDEPFPQVR